MMCENAAKHDHECMCAMCIHCYNKMQSNEEYHLEGQDDQETSNLFYYIFLYYLLLLYISSCQASTIQEKL